MVKTICDICKREMENDFSRAAVSELHFYIKVGGRSLDVCDQCKKDFMNWIETKAKEAADGECK